jgi:hypothetical protein
LTGFERVPSTGSLDINNGVRSVGWDMVDRRVRGVITRLQPLRMGVEVTADTRSTCRVDRCYIGPSAWYESIRSLARQKIHHTYLAEALLTTVAHVRKANRVLRNGAKQKRENKESIFVGGTSCFFNVSFLVNIPPPRLGLLLRFFSTTSGT